MKNKLKKIITSHSAKHIFVFALILNIVNGFLNLLSLIDYNIPFLYLIIAGFFAYSSIIIQYLKLKYD